MLSQFASTVFCTVNFCAHKVWSIHTIVFSCLVNCPIISCVWEVPFSVVRMNGYIFSNECERLRFQLCVWEVTFSVVRVRGYIFSNECERLHFQLCVWEVTFSVVRVRGYIFSCMCERLHFQLYVWEVTFSVVCVRGVHCGIREVLTHEYERFSVVIVWGSIFTSVREGCLVVNVSVFQ